MTIAVLSIIFNLLMILVGWVLLASVVFGAPFVRTKAETVKKMIALAGIKPGEYAVDLGSGDGQIVIALARAGAIAHGYEINPVLVWFSRRQVRKAGLANRAFIHWRSFWRADLSQSGVVTVFGIGHIMSKLEKKLLRELTQGSRVVSNVFTFPNWQHTSKEGTAYLYIKSAEKKV